MNAEATMDTARRLVAAGKAEFQSDRGVISRKEVAGKWYYVLKRFDKGCTQLVRVPSTEETK